MTDQNLPVLKDVFRTLDCWWHLPAYRLEPALQPFFGLFLRDILRECLEIDTHPAIIPEFPLRKDSLPKCATSVIENGHDSEKEEKTNLSVNVDFLAFSPSLESAHFVELKSDSGSINDGQINYLKRAKEANFYDLLKGVCEICKTTNQKQKYVHLLHHLEEIGLICFPAAQKENLYKRTFPKCVSGWSKAFDCGPHIKISPSSRSVIYITPTGNTDKLCKAGFREISFQEIADVVQKREDFGQMFACYLRMWTGKAGTKDPRDIRSGE